MDENGGTSSASLRERIFALDDGTAEVVDVAEWGLKLEVRSMDGNQRARFLTLLFPEPVGPDEERPPVDYGVFYPSLIIATTFDPESGEQVFRAEDGDALNTKNAAVTERLAKVAMRLSGLDRAAEDRLGKGSSGASDGSTST